MLLSSDCLRIINNKENMLLQSVNAWRDAPVCHATVASLSAHCSVVFFFLFSGLILVPIILLKTPNEELLHARYALFLGTVQNLLRWYIGFFLWNLNTTYWFGMVLVEFLRSVNARVVFPSVILRKKMSILKLYDIYCDVFAYAGFL